MPYKIFSLLAPIGRFCGAHKKVLLALTSLAILLPFAFLVLSYFLINPYKQYILDPHSQASMAREQTDVGLVLGAGITKDGKPFRELQARLDVAADALQKGYVTKLLLSGDNRFKKYDEPGAMRDYLVKVKHVSAKKLQLDYAGRSTYESCERAAKVFGVRETIIFSAGSHLPRAIFTCRHFGITAYGISSHAEANNSGRREVLARAKAVFNIYVYGEKTILGKPVKH